MNRTISAICFAVLFLAPSVAPAQDTLFEESFDGAVEPALPPLWSTTGDGWATSTSSASPGSGLNNLAHSGSAPGEIVTPPIDFSGHAGGVLSFLARRTSSYPQEALTVSASLDGGATFPVVVVGAGAALPAATSSYEPIVVALPSTLDGQSQVRLRFDGLGGTTGGSNMRIDDVSITAVVDDSEPPPPPSGNAIGFESETSTIPDSAPSISVPVRLAAANSISGIQFTLSLSSDRLVFLNALRGPAVADTTRWHLDWQSESNLVHVILLGNEASGLAPSTYDDLLSLRFQVQPLAGVPETVLLQISRAVGALADPEGTDAGMTVDVGIHAVEIVTPQAVLSLSEDSLSFGATPVGTPAVQNLLLGNPAGTRDLIVSSVASNHEAFQVPDTSYVIAPGTSVELPVTFAPSDTLFGALEGTLAISHDGSNGPTSNVPLDGTGVGGRGDVSRDGFVDVMDVVTGIDVSLGRLVLPAAELVAIDLFPFPGGDGGVDVRDLTVLVQAIVRGVWPDGATPPGHGALAQEAAPSGSNEAVAFQAFTVGIDVERTETGEFEVFLTNAVAIRGFEMELTGVDAAAVSAEVGALGLLSASHHDPDAGTFRLLMAASGNAPLAPGRRSLGRVTPEAGASELLSYATGVDQHGARFDLGTGNVSVRAEPDPTAPPKTLRIGRPYPNPYVSATGAPITIPVSGANAGSEARLEVFDMLGRQVVRRSIAARSDGQIRWIPDDDGLSLVPGVYLIRVAVGTRTETRAVTVVR